MRGIIQQVIILPAPAEELFASYLDPARHAAITGSPVTVGHKAGDRFEAFEGAITGTTLAVVRPQLIVQSWRSTNFDNKDPDSTLILTFTTDGRSGRIDLVHLDVPEQDFKGVTEGWEFHYWTPWRAYLAKA